MKFLSDRIALIFYRALVRYNLTDTQRKQIQLNKILKTQVDPVLLLYKSSVRRAVQECFTSIFMLTVVSPEYLHYLPTLLFGSLPQSRYKRHFQTFNCACSFPSVYSYTFSFPILPLCCLYHMSTVTVHLGSNLATVTW